MVACAGPTQVQARQNLSRDRGNGHHLPSRTKTLSPIGSCLQRKNQFSTIASHWYTNHAQEQSLCPAVCRQHKMNSAMSFFFFVDFFVSWCFVWEIFILLVFCLYIVVSSFVVLWIWVLYMSILHICFSCAFPHFFLIWLV